VITGRDRISGAVCLGIGLVLSWMRAKQGVLCASAVNLSHWHMPGLDRPAVPRSEPRMIGVLGCQRPWRCNP